MTLPWGSKSTIKRMGFHKRPLFFVGIYNQQFQGTIILMVFDFQGLVLQSYPVFGSVFLKAPIQNPSPKPRLQMGAVSIFWMKSKFQGIVHGYSTKPPHNVPQK